NEEFSRQVRSDEAREALTSFLEKRRPKAAYHSTKRALGPAAMTEMFIQPAKSAYQYPLLIKQLWHTPLQQAPDQEIVYRDLKRFTYLELRERIGRLASALAKIGVRPGDTVGVLDWDSNRFLEAFFAIPMMGAVLQTVNVRLSPEQIAYTINHAGASVLLASDEFTGLLE